MTCKDCLHYDLCSNHYLKSDLERINGCCSNFSNKFEWVHLPCKVGDTVYQLQTVFDEITLKSKAVVKPRIIDFVATTSFLAESKGLIFSEKDFGKTVFLTREEAEKALKEREEK